MVVKQLQWNFSIEDTLEAQLAVLYRKGVPNSEVDLCTALCGWDSRRSALTREVCLVQSVLYREVPLYCHNSPTVIAFV